MNKYLPHILIISVDITIWVKDARSRGIKAQQTPQTTVMGVNRRGGVGVRTNVHTPRLHWSLKMMISKATTRKCPFLTWLSCKCNGVSCRINVTPAIQSRQVQIVAFLKPWAVHAAAHSNNWNAIDTIRTWRRREHEKMWLNTIAFDVRLKVTSNHKHFSGNNTIQSSHWSVAPPPLIMKLRSQKSRHHRRCLHTA